jgi:hypothetical protein
MQGRLLQRIQRNLNARIRPVLFSIQMQPRDLAVVLVSNVSEGVEDELVHVVEVAPPLGAE